MVMALMLLAGGFSIAGMAVPTTASAATMAVEQCNGHGPGAAGATTAMKCTVTVVNTISGTTTYSRTTVTRLCTLGPCSTPNGTFTADSVSLVTDIKQCNTSDNDASHAIKCYVNVVNNIGRDTPNAQPLAAPTVNQCVGSGTGGGGVVNCAPSHVTGGMLTQCNGSGNGGGGKVHCTVDPQSKVSGAIPIKISQCNGSGNVGGSAVTCNASVITRISDIAATAIPTATSTPTQTTTAYAAPTSAPPTSSPAVSGAANTAAASTSGGQSGLLMLGAAVVLVAAVGTLLYRRYAPAGFLRRFARKH
jgi:hypothetical protein